MGGAHGTTLARLGVGNFRITDFDVFDWPNMNRQAGAYVSTMGQPKIDAVARQLRDIGWANLNSAKTPNDSLPIL